MKISVESCARRQNLKKRAKLKSEKSYHVPANKAWVRPRQFPNLAGAAAVAVNLYFYDQGVESSFSFYIDFIFKFHYYKIRFVSLHAMRALSNFPFVLCTLHCSLFAALRTTTTFIEQNKLASVKNLRFFLI